MPAYNVITKSVGQTAGGPKGRRGTFAERLLPAQAGGGFALDGYWVWCGSAIAGDDGTYHLYASRWPRSLAFSPHWLTNSEVVHATSPTREGPYTFRDVVLPARGAEYWDGRMTHNPTIHRAPGKNGRYLLYYTGTTYEGPTPTAENPEPAGSPRPHRSRDNQRVGLATAPTPAGPWARPDSPLIDIPPEGTSGTYDPLFTTNAAPYVHADGSVLVIYKGRSRRDDKMRHWLARAARVDGPYELVREEPIFPEETADTVEDPYLWWEAGAYHVLVHDVLGAVGGETDAIAQGTSPDGLEWRWAGLVCGRTMAWSDGRTTRQPRVERPQLLMEGGQATCLFVSTGDGPEPRRRGDRNTMARAWNAAIPLRAAGERR